MSIPAKIKVVVFTDNNAKVLINPSEKSLKDIPKDRYLINPNLSRVKGIDTHFWKIENSEILPMSKEEQQERSKVHKDVPNSNIITIPSEIKYIETIQEVIVEKVVEVEKIVEKIVEVFVDKIVEKEIIKEVPVYIEKYIEVIKEIEKPVEIIKEVIKNVEVEIIKVEEKIVEIEKKIEIKFIKHSKLAWILLAIETVGILTWILIK